MARPDPLMKILFLARHFTYFRNFESVLRDLASRGHQLHLAVEQDESLGGTKLVQSLLDEFPNVTAGVLPNALKTIGRGRRRASGSASITCAISIRSSTGHTSSANVREDARQGGS